MNESVRSDGGMMLTRGSCSWRKKICQRHFFRYRSLTNRPGIQPWPPRWKTGGQSPEPWLRSSGESWLLTSSGFMYLHDVDNHTWNCKA